MGTKSTCLAAQWTVIHNGPTICTSAGGDTAGGGGRVPEQGILRLELRLNRWISALQQYCSLHEAKAEIGLESTQQLRASE